MLGASTKKPTEFATLMLDMGQWPGSCCHPERAWRTQEGQWFFAPHFVLKGRSRAQSAEEWWNGVDALGNGGFITKGAATYPGDLNKLLALIFIHEAGSELESVTQAGSMVRTGRWGNGLLRREAARQRHLRLPGHAGLPQVSRALRVKGRGDVDDKAIEDGACLGGLRDGWNILHEGSRGWRGQHGL